jgi:hypothetical protein
MSIFPVGGVGIGKKEVCWAIWVELIRRIFAFRVDNKRLYLLWINITVKG